MTLNSFAYAGISPSNRVDEDGRFWEELFEGVGLFSSCVAAVPVLGCVGGIALAYYGYEVALDVPTYY